MPDLDEEDGEVVDEDEGGGEAVRKLHDVVVRHAAPLLACHDLEAVEIYRLGLECIKSAN